MATGRRFFALDPGTKKVFFGIILLAAIVRLIYLLQVQDSIFYNTFILDSKVLELWAKDIASGNIAGDGVFFRAPLYPYILAILISMFRSLAMPALVFQALVGAATVALVFFYARYLFNRTIATIAGILTAVWPTLIYFGGELMITTLSVFLTLAAVIAMHLSIESRNRKHLFLAGIIMGLAAITRPTVLPLFAIVPLILYIRSKKKSLETVAVLSLVYLAGLFVPILPVTIHNLAAGDDFVLISSQGGANFYIGNSKYADGLTVVMPVKGRIFDSKFSDNIYTRSVHIAESETGRKMSDSEISSFWLKKAFEDIAADPGRAVGLFITKFYYFWHGQEIFNNKSLYYAGMFSFLMKLTIWKAIINFPSGILFPFMFAGIFLALKKDRTILLPTLFLIIFSLTISLFFVCSRFRQPIVPVAIILASYAGYRLFEIMRTHSGAWKAPVMIVVATGILLNLGGDIESRENKSQYFSTLGSVYIQRGMPREAADFLERSLHIASDNQSAIGLLGQAYVEMRQPMKAERVLAHGLKLFPTSLQFNYNLGLLYLNYGKFERAKTRFNRVIELDSLQMDPYLGLGIIYEQEEKVDSAKYIYKRGLSINPRAAAVKKRLRALSAPEESR